MRSRVAAWGRAARECSGLRLCDPARAESIAESNCAACHGADGNSPDPQFPELAGQNPAYTFWQLWAFKEATRRSDVMRGIVAIGKNS
jgi:cytochrome c553